MYGENNKRSSNPSASAEHKTLSQDLSPTSAEPKKVNKNSWKYILMAMGPGLLAAFAGNDAGGIATYSSAGASFGYTQLWTVPIMCFLLKVRFRNKPHNLPIKSLPQKNILQDKT